MHIDYINPDFLSQRELERLNRGDIIRVTRARLPIRQATSEEVSRHLDPHDPRAASFVPVVFIDENA